MDTGVSLSDDDVDRIARRIVELMTSIGVVPPRVRRKPSDTPEAVRLRKQRSRAAAKARAATDAASKAPTMPRDPNPVRHGSPAAAPPSPPREDITRLCDLLAACIRRHSPEAKVKPTSEAWRRPCRLMLDTDKRPADKVEQVIRWATTDTFWAGNIMSMAAVRKHFDTLYLKAKKQPITAAVGDQSDQCPGDTALGARAVWMTASESLRERSDLATVLEGVHAHGFDGETLVLGAPAGAVGWLNDRCIPVVAAAAGRPVTFRACARVTKGDS